MLKSILVTFVALSSSSSVRAFADAPVARSLAVELEVATPGTPPFQLAVQLVEDRGCANLSSFQNDRNFEISVCSDGAGGDRPLLHVELTTDEHKGGNRTKRHWKMASRLQLEKKTVVGKLTGPDGGTVVISATTRLM